MRLILLIIWFFLTISTVFGIYQCSTFRTTYSRYVEGILQTSAFDFNITYSTNSSYYVVSLFNMHTNLTNTNAKNIYLTIWDAHQVGNNQICNNPTNCTFDQERCDIVCAHSPYNGFKMAIYYVPDGSNPIGGAFSVYNQMVYSNENFRLFTPDQPETSLSLDGAGGELWQRCLNFHYIPPPPADVTCTNFVSNTIVQLPNSTDVLFNITFTVDHTDATNTVLVNMLGEMYTNGSIYIDTINSNYNLTYRSMPDPNTTDPFPLASQENFLQMSLIFTDDDSQLSAELIPIEFYSVNGLRLRKDFSQFHLYEPYGNPSIGPNNGLDVISSFLCTGFVQYPYPPPNDYPPPPPPTSTCPPGWYQGLSTPNKCYSLYANYYDAGTGGQYCSTYNGTLVSIDTAFENAEITKVFSIYSSMCSQAYIDYVGVNGTYNWQNGDPHVYTNWRCPPPNTTSPSCGYLYLSGKDEGHWCAEDCATKECSICQVVLH